MPTGMRQNRQVDGFRLAYDRIGEGAGAGKPAVLLLHGWPGDRTDYREVVPLLPGADVVVPDLRGFGESDKHEAESASQYTAAAQARSLIGLIVELALGQRPASAPIRQRPASAPIRQRSASGPADPGLGFLNL